MKTKNKTANYIIHIINENRILDYVEYLASTALNTITHTVNYSYRISETSIKDNYNIFLSLEFTGLNYYNFFKETNYITSKITKVLTGDSFIEEVFTNCL